MADTVAITNLQITPLDPEQMTRPMVESGCAWYEVTATIESRSSATMFVMTSVRRSEYEADRRTLVFDLSEHNQVESPRVSGLPLPPIVEAIRPGAETRVAWRLSSPIVIMELGAGEDRARFIHLEADVDTIECVVAYSDVAPRLDTNLASMEPPPSLRTWGDVTRASVTLKARET